MNYIGVLHRLPLNRIFIHKSGATTSLLYDEIDQKHGDLANEKDGLCFGTYYAACRSN
jgi:hypothetical protein